MLAVVACSKGKAAEEASQEDGSFLEQLTPRDSILIADRLRYGFVLSGVEEGTGIALPEVKDSLMYGIEVLSPWKIDTLRTEGKDKKVHTLRGSLTITSFDEGR